MVEWPWMEIACLDSINKTPGRWRSDYEKSSQSAFLIVYPRRNTEIQLIPTLSKFPVKMSRRNWPARIERTSTMIARIKTNRFLFHIAFSLNFREMAKYGVADSSIFNYWNQYIIFIQFTCTKNAFVWIYSYCINVMIEWWVFIWQEWIRSRELSGIEFSK